MLDLRSDAVRKEIQAFSQRLGALKDELQERGGLSETTRTTLNQIQQHKERLETKLSNAERAGNWDSIKKEFVEDWDSLVLDVSTLENQLYE